MIHSSFSDVEFCNHLLKTCIVSVLDHYSSFYLLFMIKDDFLLTLMTNFFKKKKLNMLSCECVKHKNLLRVETRFWLCL